MLSRKKPAGFIIQVPGEQITKPSVDQTKDDGVSVDRVRCRISFEVLFFYAQRFMTDSWTLGRVAKEPQCRFSTHVRHEGSKHLNSQVSIVEKGKGLVVAELQSPDLYALSAVVFRQSLLPLLERLVHVCIGHCQEIVFQTDKEQLAVHCFGRAKLFGLGDIGLVDRARAFDNAVVVDALWLHEQPLSLHLVGFRLKDLREAGEMVGVSMGDNDALDFLRVRDCRSTKTAGQIASEHLIVAAVDKDDFSIR